MPSRKLACVVGMVVAVAMAAGGGCYAPHIGDGTLICFNHKECPSGFHWADDSRCYDSPGHTGAGGAAASDAAGDRDIPRGEGGSGGAITGAGGAAGMGAASGAGGSGAGGTGAGGATGAGG